MEIQVTQKFKAHSKANDQIKMQQATHSTPARTAKKSLANHTLSRMEFHRQMSKVKIRREVTSGRIAIRQMVNQLMSEAINCKV